MTRRASYTPVKVWECDWCGAWVDLPLTHDRWHVLAPQGVLWRGGWLKGYGPWKGMPDELLDDEWPGCPQAR